MLRPRCLMFGSLLLLIAMRLPSDRIYAEQTVVVVLDDSGSMERTMSTRQSRIVAAKQALATVLRGLPSDTQVGILALNSQINGSHWIVPVGSPAPERWQKPLMHVRANGGTLLGQFVEQGANELLSLRSKQPYASYRLLVVTDGEANDAPKLAAILPDMLSRGINLDVIGVDMQADHSLALSAHSYRRASDQAALAQALSEVFAETADAGQASQEDFDLLTGLDDDAAAAIVKELSAPRNTPLEVVAPLEVAGAVQSSPPGFSPGTAGSQNPANSRMSGSGLLSFCCLGSLGIIIFFIAALIFGALKFKPRS